MISKKNIYVTTGLIFSLFFLLVSFYELNFQAFFHTFKNIGIDALLLCTIFTCLAYITRAFMWRITTVSLKALGLSDLFGGVVVGYMINGILPFRVGELFRAHYLSSLTGCSRTTAFSTVFIERILDIVSLGLLVIIALFFGVQGLSLDLGKAVIILWLTAVMLAGILIANSEKIEVLERKFAIIPHRFWTFIANFVAPFSQLREVRKIFYLLLMSILSWVFIYLSLLVLIYSSVSVFKYEAALLLFLFVNLSMLIPAAPGGLGVVQVAFWMSLSFFDVPKEAALAFSFAYLFVAYVINTGLGLPYFLKAHLWEQRKIITKEEGRQAY